MGILDAIRGVAGNLATDSTQASDQIARERREDHQQQLKMTLAPLSLALRADQVRLATYADANDPMKAQPGKEKEFQSTLDRMTQTIGQMRSAVGDTSPHAGILDHLHIRRDLQNRIANYNDQTGKMAQATAAGELPFEQTPEGQKLAYQRGTEEAVAKYKYTPLLKPYKLPDGSTQWLDAKRPENIPKGSNAISIAETVPHAVKIFGADGKSALAVELGGKYYDQEGKEIPNAKPYEKPAMPQPKAGMSDGQNAWGLLTDNGWVDAGTKQPLPNFKPNPSFGQLGLYDLATMQTPNGFTSVMYNRRNGQVVAAGNGLVDPKIMGEVNKALEPARDADTRYRVMADNEVKALGGKQQSMLLLVANHIGMTLGQQKGSRITQAVWNEAIESAPWLARAKSRFNSDGYLSGVTLTPDQIEQMVELAKERRMRLWQQVQQTGKQYGVQIDVPSDLDRPSLEVPRTKQLKQAAKEAKTGGKKYKVGDPVTQNGHNFKVTAVDANGKVTDAVPVQ
jgi:hypothetical protein